MSANPHTILALMRLLGRWFPSPPLPQGVTYEQLHAKWKRFDRITDVLFLPVAVVLMVMFYYLFRGIVRWHTARLAAAYGSIRYLLGVSTAELVIAAIFIGF